MSMIALDLETTGLNPKQDRITEIAAVRFSGTRVEAQFQTLVNPQIPIPQNITLLTHISNEMVRNAPLFEDVIDQLIEFVGDDAIVGQNVGFDIGFLRARKKDIFYDNPVYDTYEMASVLIPDAIRYNLGALAQQMGIIVQDQHRALADCVTTYQVFNRLSDLANDLSVDILLMLIRVCGLSGWSGVDLLRHIVQEKQARGETRTSGFSIPMPKMTGIATSELPEMEPAEKLEPLDEDEIAAILEYGGEFSRYFPNYEQRKPQIQMLRTICNAFSNGRHMFIEAGTGTGKSFAYLIPSVYWAMKNGEKVVISTNTINLQDQLISKDIPDLSKALGIDIIATVQKGRSNYLCPKRFTAEVSRGAANSDEMRVLGKTLVWLYQGGNGDRSQINLNGPAEREFWQRISAENEGCRSNKCVFRRQGKCPFFAVKDRVMRSQIIIVNHALLMADAAMGKAVLPDYRYLIVDEGHHLESAATSALSWRTTPFDLSRMNQELGTSVSGMIGRTLTMLSEQISADTYVDFRSRADHITELSSGLEPSQRDLFNCVEQFMREARNGERITVYGQQQRITSAERCAPGWSDVEIAWDNLHTVYTPMLKDLTQFYKDLMNLEDLDDDTKETIDLLGGLLEKIIGADRNMDMLFANPDQGMIYWIDLSAVNSRLSLNAAPLEVGPLVEQFFWHEKDSVIVTSATLATEDDSFDYMRSRLSADEAEELVLDSPFDYESSVLLYLPNDIPDQNMGSAQKMVEDALVRLVSSTGGRTLALFTSYAQLKRTSAAISPQLEKLGIRVYEQGEGVSASTLLDSFRNTDQAILLGTRSFWEGVDVQGEALSVVVIVKLPFDVPSDPIIAARSETFENPFAQYSLPEAILKFRQGFGRLIRSQSDRGLVVVLDNRLLKKQYGRDFIKSIPLCTQRVGSIRDLPREATRFLNL